ncbi:MAG: DUF2281 domain-containing protein [Methylomonas sp.]|jgi:hypothetical protein
MNMGFAELIEHLQTQPESKQAEVFDYVEFLVQKNRESPENGKTLADYILPRPRRFKQLAACV